MTATGELKLHERARRSDIAPEHRGPMLPANSIALEVWENRFSGKWVIQKMAPEIGFKLGKAWYFYKREAEHWRDQYVEQHRGGAA